LGGFGGSISSFYILPLWTACPPLKRAADILGNRSSWFVEPPKDVLITVKLRLGSASPTMTKRFGTTPPSGGRTLHQAAFELAVSDLLNTYQTATLDWERAGKPGRARTKTVRLSSGAPVRLPIGGSPLFSAQIEARRTLFADVRRQLRSGELRAIGLELGSFSGQYEEIAPEHWKVLKVRDWQKSLVERRSGGALVEVRVYPRAQYEQFPTEPIAQPPPKRRGKTTLADRIVAAFEATDAETRARWKTKTDAARDIRNAVDGKGDEPEGRRYVLEVLSGPFAPMFPDAPDGITAH
jgi:hypothetical protein